METYTPSIARLLTGRFGNRLDFLSETDTVAVDRLGPLLNVGNDSLCVAADNHDRYGLLYEVAFVWHQDGSDGDKVAAAWGRPIENAEIRNIAANYLDNLLLVASRLRLAVKGAVCDDPDEMVFGRLGVQVFLTEPNRSAVVQFLRDAQRISFL